MSLGSSRASYAKMSSSDKEQDGISPVGALGKKGGRGREPWAASGCCWKGKAGRGSCLDTVECGTPSSLLPVGIVEVAHGCIPGV